MQWSEGDSSIVEQPSDIDLQYPTIPVYGTPSSWLSQSQLVTMTSNPDDSSFDDTSSSLGDSTYDFVDDKSAVVSDDEDRDQLTQSVSSNEDRELEPRGQGDYRHHINDKKGSQPSRSRASSLSFDHDDAFTTGSQSNSDEASPGNEHNIIKTNKNMLDRQERDRQRTIQLHESMNTAPGSIKEIEGSYTLKFFKEHEVSEMLHHFRMGKPPAQVIATIRQTVVSQRLGLNGPYRVLYVGNVSAKDSIIRKLGSALAASLGSEVFQRSRFNIVPISSFGDATSPEVVLIDSTGLEMNVEECISASFTKMEGGNDTVSMTLSNQRLVESYWSGTEHVVTDHWNLPDLAVFYLTESDNISAKQTRHFARKFMSRHKVPCVVISQHPLWAKPAEIIALNQKTPHLCLETQCSEFDGFRIIKRLPIDKETFLELDAVQMNRNMAYLATARQSSSAPPTLIRPDSKCEPHGASKSSTKNRTYLTSFSYFKESGILEKLPLVEKVLTSSLLLVLGLLLYHFTVNSYFALGSPRATNNHENPANTVTAPHFLLSQPIAAASVSSLSVSALISKPASSLVNQPSNPKIRPVPDINTDIASFLLHRDALLPNKSEEFYIKIIGDYHIVLKAPQWLTRSKRNPKIKFSVLRGDKIIKYQVSTLFDGVYALEIPREDAYGSLNVSISTMSKPRINKSFELYFGTSWFKGFGWKKTAQTVSGSMRSDLGLLRGLTLAYNYTSTEIRSFVDGAWDKATGARKGVDKVRLASLDKTNKATDVLLLQPLDFSRNLSRQLGRKTLAASKHVAIYAEDICKDIVAYGGNTSFVFSQQALKLSQVASSSIKSSVQGFIESRKTHLRETQKKTLKAWWKIRGLPKRQLANNPLRVRSHTRPVKKNSR